jgi:hypothetical protein
MINTQINNNKERVKGYTLKGIPKTFLFGCNSFIELKGGLKNE